jgi:RHS repeat-associated protein
MHQDQLGNLALVTSGGSRVDDQGFYAYGRLRRGIIGVERGFTGQQKDFSSGLMYFNARYYDPELGQFLSPDTLVPDPGNLFAWNRYMYTIGNPMRYNDPSGHNWEDVIVTVVDFAQGVGAQVGYNNTVVALPSEINSFAPQAGESTSMQVGRFVGNVVTAVQGVAEISGGAGLGGAGVAACATGVGCVATAPAVVGASAVIAHGATVATIGAVNAGTQLGNAVMAMTGSNSDSPQIDPKDVAGKTPAEIDEFAKQKGLLSKGPDPQNGKGSYIDPVTGNQRILSHPLACPPHCHVNNAAGQRLDVNGNIVAPESPAAHLPLKPN